MSAVDAGDNVGVTTVVTADLQKPFALAFCSAYTEPALQRLTNR